MHRATAALRELSLKKNLSLILGRFRTQNVLKCRELSALMQLSRCIIALLLELTILFENVENQQVMETFIPWCSICA